MHIDEVFRTEWSRVVATLVRDFGDLALAEDCAQDAFVEASTRWEHEGQPERPGAWLTTTARRKALDQVRRASSYQDKLAELQARSRLPVEQRDNPLLDEQLALLLGCCHPALNREAQVALTLRMVGGLTTEQIAHAFLIEEATMGKRITRAKAKIKAANIPFHRVDRQVLAERLDVVHHVIYLIFTEGHASRSDTELVRGDLCDEATWLASLLVELLPDDSESRGLLALILLTDARRPTRVDADGLPILLEDQDRGAWDRDKITRGITTLSRAEGPLGRLGLQAVLASLHAGPATFADTDWPRIVRTYDLLVLIDPSPIVALNRAVAVSFAEGPQSGLDAIEPLRQELDSYLYLHTARADLFRRLGRNADAAACYQRALACGPGASEAAFIARRLALVDGA